MKRKWLYSFKSRLIILIFLPVSITLLAIVFFLSQNIFKNTFAFSKKESVAKAQQAANEVKSYIDNALTACEVIALSYQEWKENNGDHRLLIDNIMKRTLAQSKDYLSVWSQFEYDKSKAASIKEFTIEKSLELFGTAWLKSGSNIVIDYVGEDYESFYTEDYYTVPKISMKEAVVEPFDWIYPGDVTKTKYYETSCLQPIIVNGNFFGVVGIDIELTKLHEIVRKYNPSKNGTFGIITSKHVFAMHTDTSLNHHSMYQTLKIDSVSLSKKLRKQSVVEFEIFDTTRNAINLVTIVKIPLRNTDTNWYCFVEIPKEEITTEASSQYTFAVLIGLFTLLILIFVLIFLGNNFTKPILQGVEFAKRLSEGKLYVKFNPKTSDEIKVFSVSLNIMVDKISETVKKIKDLAELYNQTSKTIQISATETSVGATKQAVAIEEISVSMEELVKSIKNNSIHAINTEQMAKQASTEMKTVADAVFATHDSLRTIIKKISIINEIAEKTDMLAINAAIESVRAGEYGKGFAVVASEIRELAEDSQRAAKSIGNLSNKTMTDSQSASQLIQIILDKISQTSFLVQEISQSTTEQQKGIQQVNNSLQHINSFTQNNASVAENLNKHAAELAFLANSLLDTISFFSLSKQDENNSMLLKNEIEMLQQKINELLQSQNFA